MMSHHGRWWNASFTHVPPPPTHTHTHARTHLHTPTEPLSTPCTLRVQDVAIVHYEGPDPTDYLQFLEEGRCAGFQVALCRDGFVSG